MLTMTRTRTQTALTKLAEMVANVHGELEFLAGLLQAAGPTNAVQLTAEVRARLQARELQLCQDKAALYATLRQFDATIDPEGVGASAAWHKRLGRKGLSGRALIQRYCTVMRAT